MRHGIIFRLILAMVMVLIPALTACTASGQEVRGVLQDINADGEISILTQDGRTVIAQVDSTTTYENNGKQCLSTDLPSGSLVALAVINDRAVSVREYDDDDEDDPGTPTPTPTGSGAQLYAGYCAQCHNATPPTSWRSDSTSELTEAINEGPGSMPSYSGILTSAQVTSIVQYIQGSSPTNTPPPTAPAADGAQIYASNCAGCHGANRTGATARTLPNPSYQTAASPI